MLIIERLPLKSSACFVGVLGQTRTFVLLRVLLMRAMSGEMSTIVFIDVKVLGEEALRSLHCVLHFLKYFLQILLGEI